MIEFGDNVYYIDFNAIDKLVSSNELDSKEIEEREETITFDENGDQNGKILTIKKFVKSKEIDVSKYEIFRLLIETVIDYPEIEDDTLGAERALDKTPLAYKIAFNTLLSTGILKIK